VSNSCVICPFQVLDSGLNTLHVPYSYGFSIILLTLLVKVATFPLTKKQASPSRPSHLCTPLERCRPLPIGVKF